MRPPGAYTNYYLKLKETSMAPYLHIALPLLGTMVFLSAGCTTRTVAQSTQRVVTVAQSGSADIVGSNSESLQKAANLLHPGDVLSIGAGT